MRGKAVTFNKLYFLYTVRSSQLSFSLQKALNHYFSSSSSSPLAQTLEIPCIPPNCKNSASNPLNPSEPHPVDNGLEDYMNAFRKYGCNDQEITRILYRKPSILKTNLTTLQSKLRVLHDLGLVGSDLAKIRPRILTDRFEQGLDRRVEFLETLFGSKQMVLKIVLRNSSILSYDVDKIMKPRVALYEEMGIDKEQLVVLLGCRPMLVPRSSFTKEKLDYIHKVGVSKESKMYKYVVSLIASSRLETIQEKVTNFEKFGFSFDEVMGLFRCSPYIFTLSVEKVQRNMTFIIGIMKLPANVVLSYPFLISCGLEKVLKPRFVLSEKIQSMGLLPQIKGPRMVRALKMVEPRFLKTFVACHEKDVAELLMGVYMEAKGAKRLAESSWMVSYKGFPF